MGGLEEQRNFGELKIMASVISKEQMVKLYSLLGDIAQSARLAKKSDKVSLGAFVYLDDDSRTKGDAATLTVTDELGRLHSETFYLSELTESDKLTSVTERINHGVLTKK